MKYFGVLYTILRCIGFIPPEKFDRFFELRMKIILGMLYYEAFGVGLYFVVAVRDSNVPIAEKAESFFIISGIFNMIYNITASFLNRQKIMTMFRDLEDFSSFGLPDNLLFVCNAINAFAFCFAIYCVFGTLTVCTFAFYDYENCVWAGQMVNRSVLCGFAAKVAYPYNIRSGPLLYVHLLLEAFTICFSCTGGVMVVPATSAAFEMIVLRLEHLKIMLKEVFQVEGDDARKDRFRKCVFYHIYIIELSDKIYHSFELVTTPALINYSICIGTTLLAFLAGHTITSFLNLCGWVTGILCLSFTGQRIHDKSLSISETAYDMEWYTASPKLRRDVLFMIARANKPIMFRCGVLGDFHFVTFQNMMSTAYKFSTLKSSS